MFIAIFSKDAAYTELVNKLRKSYKESQCLSVSAETTVCKYVLLTKTKLTQVLGISESR